MHTREYIEDRYHVREYDTLAEWFATARIDRAHQANAERDERDPTRSDSWRGGTISEAETMTTWPAGLELYRGLTLDNIKFPDPISRKRRRRFATDGDEFDRDRFAIGLPECWESRRRMPTQTTSAIVRVTVDICASASETAESLAWTGLAAVRIIDELESRGFSVELAGTCTSGGTFERAKHNALDIFTVKAADDPVDVDTLLFAIAHPFALRFFWFAACYRRPWKVSSGLGHCQEPPDFARGDIHIAKCFTRDAAINTVSAALAQYALDNSQS